MIFLESLVTDMLDTEKIQCIFSMQLILFISEYELN